MSALGAPELLVILVILLVVFGGAKLPRLARSLGSSKREFEQARSEPQRVIDRFDHPEHHDAA